MYHVPCTIAGVNAVSGREAGDRVIAEQVTGNCWGAHWTGPRMGWKTELDKGFPYRIKPGYWEKEKKIEAF